MASLQEYLTQYTKENRMEFMKLCLSKYLFHEYKISDFNIKDEHRIIQNTKLRSEIQEIINSGSCSKEDFTKIFNQLEPKQINYIGF